MSHINWLLEEIWLSASQSNIFVHLYQYGPKPASSVAKMVGWERTNIYKTIQVLVRQWLVAETTKNWVKQFFVPEKDVLRRSILQKKQLLEKQEEALPLIEGELLKIDEQRASPLPKMRFFEGKEWMENLFEDIASLIQEKKYVMIKCFASNTLESQSHSSKQFQHYAWSFLKHIQKNNIHVEMYLGNGILTLEQIFKTHNHETLASLPAWSASTNVFIVWDTIYLIIYKQVPFGLKLESGELADMFHFLLRQV